MMHDDDLGKDSSFQGLYREPATKEEDHNNRNMVEQYKRLSESEFRKATDNRWRMISCDQPLA